MFLFRLTACRGSSRLLCVQVASLSGIQRLPCLEMLSVAGTRLMTDSLLLLGHCPSLRSLDVSNTENIDGDLALEYIAGRALLWGCESGRCM